MKLSSVVAGFTLFAIAVVSIAAKPGHSGSGHLRLNLVSPATAPIQIRQGLLTLGVAAPATPAPGTANQSSALQLQLVLTGASSNGASVTSTGNHIVITGTFTSSAGDQQPISIDEMFDINGGTAAVQATVDLSSFKIPGAIEISSASLHDGRGNAFASVGFPVGHGRAKPTKAPKPTHTPKPPKLKTPHPHTPRPTSTATP